MTTRAQNTSRYFRQNQYERTLADKSASQRLQQNRISRYIRPPGRRAVYSTSDWSEKLREETGTYGPNASFSPDSSHIWVRNLDEMLGEALLSRDISGLSQTQFIPPPGQLFSSSGRFAAVVFHEGQFDADEQELLFLDESGNVIRSINTTQNYLNDAVFSADETMIATGGDSPEIKVWDTASGKQLHAWDGGGKRIMRLAISPDNRFLVLANDLHQVNIIRMDDGILIRSLDLGTIPSGALSWSPEGRYLAMVRYDNKGFNGIITVHEIGASW